MVTLVEQILRHFKARARIQILAAVATPVGRQPGVVGNQGLLAITFFEATAFIVLLVLFFLFRRDHPASYFRLWLKGWACLTLSALFEVGLDLSEISGLRVAALCARVAALL